MAQAITNVQNYRKPVGQLFKTERIAPEEITPQFPLEVPCLKLLHGQLNSFKELFYV